MNDENIPVQTMVPSLPDEWDQEAWAQETLTPVVRVLYEMCAARGVPLILSVQLKSDGSSATTHYLPKGSHAALLIALRVLDPKSFQAAETKSVDGEPDPD